MDRLSVSPDEFRRLAARAVERAARYLERLRDLPSFPATSGAESLATFDRPLPARGMGAAAFDEIENVIANSRPCGPAFFGYVLGSGEPVAAVADLVASVLNQNVTAWRSGPAAVTIERTVVRWLAEAIGCPGFTGSLTGGGSMANLMALAMARDGQGTIYASSEAHMSIPKAAALLGLGHDAVRAIAVNESFRMIPEALDRAIEEDVRAGKRPLAVVATAGTVNTGSIDPLEEIAEIADRRGLWLHVDGAYGALAALTVPERFRGLDRADSISLDPHKWLYQPLDCGCLLFRDRTAARAAFSHTGDYARTLQSDPVESFAFFDESLELSRRFRALKLWLSLRYHGVDAFRDAIRGDLALAQRLASRIDAEPALERLAPVALSAVCFRHEGSDDFNLRILRRTIARGRVYLSNATVHGRFALRACIVNHRSTEEDVDAVVAETLAAAGQESA
ncbi:MAG TPA: aminotransferase class I/II-fold pyridoxal phosphate-dependent enzyme [Candidatus Polarisedimenticolaceae bacterium]|nr:aminotransferase class I/II-fold pyridoxal phosphate-dependent enzyme [Candidatus Polarisedimenticolaceae bacterium]